MNLKYITNLETKNSIYDEDNIEILNNYIKYIETTNSKKKNISKKKKYWNNLIGTKQLISISHPYKEYESKNIKVIIGDSYLIYEKIPGKFNPLFLKNKINTESWKKPYIGVLKTLKYLGNGTVALKINNTIYLSILIFLEKLH